MSLHEDIDEPDEAIENWGENALVQTLYTGQSVHVPFYRTLYYPDVLDLRYQATRSMPSPRFLTTWMLR